MNTKFVKWVKDTSLRTLGERIRIGKRWKQRSFFCPCWELLICSRHSSHRVRTKPIDHRSDLRLRRSSIDSSLRSVLFGHLFSGHFPRLLLFIALLFSQHRGKQSTRSSRANVSSLSKVRETLSRRLQTTSMWSRWKRYLAKNEQYRDVPIQSDDRTRLEVFNPHSTPVSVSRRDDRWFPSIDFLPVWRNEVTWNWWIVV